MTTEQKTRKPVMTVAIIAFQICVIMTAFGSAQGQGQTTRLSVDSADIQGNGGSSSPSISANGRFVAFQSYTSNLVAEDTNGRDDIFVHDRETGQTTRVSVDSAGIQGNGQSGSPSISADGRFVVFESYASNLVTGDTNGMSDVFVNGVFSVFEDVSLWYWAYDFIMAVYNRGMTGGCLPSPLRFCPDSVVTRSQMAVFIETSLGHPANNCTGRFTDVAMDSPFCGFIERMAEDGITGGCEANHFCPDAPVTRGQMSVFIEAALGHTSSTCAGQFSDVPIGHPFCRFIEHLAGDGITSGCGGGNYCPDAPVTRAQMAVFLAAAAPVPP